MSVTGHHEDDVVGQAEILLQSGVNDVELLVVVNVRQQLQVGAHLLLLVAAILIVITHPQTSVSCSRDVITPLGKGVETQSKTTVMFINIACVNSLSEAYRNGIAIENADVTRSTDTQ